jgi:hypothetical protein
MDRTTQTVAVFIWDICSLRSTVSHVNISTTCRYKQRMHPDQPHYDSWKKQLYALAPSDTYAFDIKVWKMETERTDCCGNCIINPWRDKAKEMEVFELWLQAQHIVLLLQYTSCFITVFLGGQLHQCWVRNQRFGDLLCLHHQCQWGSNSGILRYKPKL